MTQMLDFLQSLIILLICFYLQKSDNIGTWSRDRNGSETRWKFKIDRTANTISLVGQGEKLPPTILAIQ